MSQQVKEPAAKPDDLSLVWGSYVTGKAKHNNNNNNKTTDSRKWHMYTFFPLHTKEIHM